MSAKERVRVVLKVGWIYSSMRSEGKWTKSSMGCLLGFSMSGLWEAADHRKGFLPVKERFPTQLVLPESAVTDPPEALHSFESRSSPADD